MKWNLRMVAAQRDLWRPTQLRKAFEEVGFTPSLSEAAALWSQSPVTVRLDDLDRICAALDCTVAELLHAEPLAGQTQQSHAAPRAVGDDRPSGAPVSRRSGKPSRALPPN
ncbi:MAG: helix-turn-helix domain-containing protein [Pseudonocardiaceae bacterium]